MKLFKQERKSQILKPPQFGCLKGIPSINITRGCIHSCVYCYARGFTDAPPPGEVYLYANLPEKIEEEIDRKRKKPLWVSFSTASDPFQPSDEILEITYRVMKTLLERGTGISFLTKGFIPPEFIDLFKKYPGKVKGRIGIVSSNREYRRLFEPRSAYPIQRITNIKNLIQANIEVSVRVDPVIPGVTDSPESFEHLLRRLKASGVHEISVSFLVLRPSIMNFFHELPWNITNTIIRFYKDQPWQKVITSAKTKLLPPDMRARIYRTIKDIANQYGINCSICGCKNPDLPWEFCTPWVDS